MLWLGLLVLATKPDRDYLFGDSLHYAAIAKSIAQDSDWLHLRLGEEPYFRKPPGMFWVGASLFRLLGASTATARLVGILAGLGTLLLVLHLARRVLGPERAFAAAFVLGTTAMFAKYSSGMRLDVPLTLCLVASLTAVVAGRRRPWLRSLFWVGVAAGMLIKGPAGLFPVGVLVAWSLLRGRLEPWNDRRFWLGLVALPALLLPWPLHNLHLHGDRFVQTYFVDDLHATMVAVQGRGSRLKYATDLLREYWPWLPFCLHGTWLALRARWRGDRSDTWTLPLAWTLGVFGMLLCVKTARTRYLVPALPALSMLAAHSLLALWPRLVGPVTFRRVACFLAIAHAALLFTPLDIHGQRTPDIVRFAPLIESLDDGHAWVMDDELPRLLHSAALFYTDLQLEPVPAELLRQRLANGNRQLLVMRPDRQVLPDGLHARTLDDGTTYRLVEVAAASVRVGSQ